MYYSEDKDFGLVENVEREGTRSRNGLDDKEIHGMTSAYFTVGVKCVLHTERDTMNGSSTVLEHNRSSKKSKNGYTASLSGMVYILYTIL